MLSHFHIHSHRDCPHRGLFSNFKINSENSRLIKARIVKSYLRTGHAHPFCHVLPLYCQACGLLATPELCSSITPEALTAVIVFTGWNTDTPLFQYKASFSLYPLSGTLYKIFHRRDPCWNMSSVSQTYLSFPQPFNALVPNRNWDLLGGKDL